MYLLSKALIFALLVISTLDPIVARKSFGGGRASYPKSGGLSGGHHSSGHGYPSSGGLSGGGHGYPSSGSHGYPSSGSHGYPSSSNHGYPSSPGLSGNSRPTSNHGYPAGPGLSGNTPSRYPSNTHHSNTYPSNTHSSGSTNVHHHYHYSPPQQISYTPRTGGPAVHYPVYHGTPPTYVYQYKDSGSKYGTLLTGLALLNLGTLAGAAYASSHRHSDYKPTPGEICKFAVRKDNGDYEETKIDCRLITSFILQDQTQSKPSAANSTTTTTIVSNTTTTITNITNPAAAPEPNATVPIAYPTYQMLPNGTLVPINVTVPGVNITTPVVNATSDATNNSMTSSVSVTTTVTNTTVVNALDLKGKPVEVTPGMKCFVIRLASGTTMRKTVDCGLLQTYADRSLRRNSASRNVPMLTILAVAIAGFLVY